MSWVDGFAFPLDEDVAMIQQMARSFAEQDVLPLAAELDRDARYPQELVSRMSELGFMGAMIDPEYGGSGLSTLAYCLIIEELAAACASTAIIMSAHNSLCLAPIARSGTDAQKSEYLPKLCSGEHLGSFALSEPGTGSDAANLQCMVRKDGDEYVINGLKWFTSGAGNAAYTTASRESGQS